ncbi:MAG: hypothetical protein NDI82_10220 [Anaeromyxobacteraceae bacterium]|nr:hypothetical protein [Anaeromyxobacteraceae bacterium]
MRRRPENRRRTIVHAAALRPPPSFPAVDREALTAAVGLAVLVAALLLG